MGSLTPSYDARGNLTADGAGNGYYYTAENRLSVAWLPDYRGLAYDALGRPHQTATASTLTRFDHLGATILSEYDGSNALQRRYVPGPGTDEPVLWYEGSGTSNRRWLHADERGSVIATSDSSGNLVGTTNRYDEYGIPQGTLTGRFGFTGQAWLPEFGLYYYRARTYSPTYGRFLQCDPIGFGSGMNIYAYVLNDPVNLIDPSGLGPDDPPCTDCTGPEIEVVGSPRGPGGWITIGILMGLEPRSYSENGAGGTDGPPPTDPCGGRLTTNPTASGRLAIPAPGTRQGAPGFGNRPGGHPGIDFANPVGAQVYAAGAGRVVKADGISDPGGYGNQIVIHHGGGVYTQYGHLGTMSVRVDANVTAGQVIGTTARPGDRPGGAGNMGTGMSPQVHFEVRIGSALARSVGGNPINPQRCLPRSP